MSKAPRADIALLRKLKAARSDPQFVPSELLSKGNELLDRVWLPNLCDSASAVVRPDNPWFYQANQLKGFLRKQHSRTDSTSTKTEWLLTYQKLQEER
jgi:hypothetical protein